MATNSIEVATFGLQFLWKTYQKTNLWIINYELWIKVTTFAPDSEKSGCSAVGSALRSGRRGRVFKSRHPDHKSEGVSIVMQTFDTPLCFRPFCVTIPSHILSCRSNNWCCSEGWKYLSFLPLPQMKRMGQKESCIGYRYDQGSVP